MGRNVVALTFTNKAAREMDERVKTLVDRKLGKGLTISTFHSLGVKLLREEARNAGLKPDVYKRQGLPDDHPGRRPGYRHRRSQPAVGTGRHAPGSAPLRRCV